MLAFSCHFIYLPMHNVMSARVMVHFHGKGIGYGDSPLGGLFHGFLNSINIDPNKIRPEFFIVRGVIIDNMLVGPDNMLVRPDG